MESLTSDVAVEVYDQLKDFVGSFPGETIHSMKVVAEKPSGTIVGHSTGLEIERTADWLATRAAAAARRQ